MHSTQRSLAETAVKIPRRRLEGTRRKRVLGSALLLIFSLLASGVTVEIALRLMGHHGEPRSPLSNIYRVADPVLDWRYVPSSRVEVGRIVRVYNSAGFRDVEHTITNPMLKRRIVVVGDSVTEGYGVEWTSVFAPLIQSQLGDEYEVINLAMQGLNSPQEVHLLEQSGLAYEPRLVILNFILNDVDFSTRLSAAERFTAGKDAILGLFNIRVNPRVKRFLKSSALIYLTKESVESLWGRFFAREQTDYFTRIWTNDINRRRVTEAFDRVASLQRAHQFDFVVIIWPLIMNYQDYRFDFAHAWVREQARQRGFAVIDLLPTFARLPYRQLQETPDDNVHPNALGHRLGADAFIAWYRARAYLSSYQHTGPLGAPSSRGVVSQ